MIGKVGMAGSEYDRRGGSTSSGYRADYGRSRSGYPEQYPQAGHGASTGNGHYQQVPEQAGYGADAANEYFRRSGYGANAEAGPYQSAGSAYDDSWRYADTSGDLLRSLKLTLLTIFIPGIGHAAAGRKGTGRVLLTAYLILIASLIIAFTLLGVREVRALVTDTRVLQYLAIACGVLAIAWAGAVVSTYLVNKPRGLSGFQGATAGLLVLVLSAGMLAVLGVPAYLSLRARDLIISTAGESSGAFSGAKKLDYFRERNLTRINVMLLGGDWNENRSGIRTDSMMVASIDTRTGQTLMISLPRNLNKAPFPVGTKAHAKFPDGFQCSPEIECYLNAAYKYGEDNPSIVPGAQYPGAKLLSSAISEILDLEIHYFAMVNLDGFEDIVDALGGIQLRVTERIPIGGKTLANGTKIPPHGYIEPGLYKDMDGRTALWYARSRSGADDYARMDRQRCVMGAIARQADPQTVLTKFNSLASATKKVVLMDIPADALPALIELAGKGKSTKITGVSVDKTAFGSNSDPDYVVIKARSQAWIRKAEVEAEKTLAAATASPTVSPSPTATATTPPKPKPKPTPTPTPGQVAAIESACKYK